MFREWPRFRSPDGHESEETLLLFIDGALEPREDERTARHLRECWQCRAAKERIEAAIGAFMHERRHAIPDAEAEFEIRLRRRLARAAAAAPPRRSFPSAVIRRVAWPLAATAAAIAGVGRWEPGQRFVVDLLAPAQRPAVRMASIPSPTLARSGAPLVTPALRKALPEIEPGDGRSGPVLRERSHGAARGGRHSAGAGGGEHAQHRRDAGGPPVRLPGSACGGISGR